MGATDDHNRPSPSSVWPLRQIDEPELKQILERHQQWAQTRAGVRPPSGEPADLSCADLGGVNLAGFDLRQVNFQGACLRGADLSGANLLDADLRQVDLRDANLSGADLPLCKQLAGADVAGARLPGTVLKFEGLEIVEQISRNARTIMFSLLLACVYTWLTIATTTDPLLLANSISSPLPIIRTEIPIAGFFWVAPLILLAMYLYFHLYLQRLWETLAELPAVFPDGTRLDKRAYPWLLNCLVTSQFERLRDSRPQFSRLQTCLAILLAWCTVPVTFLALWLRYLPRHDWLGTILHIALVMAAIGCGRLFYRAATATLRRDIEPALLHGQFLGRARGLRRAAWVGGMFVVLCGFSFGAIQGVPAGSPHAADISGLDARLWVPRIMEALGNSTFVDFIEEDLSTKPANWVEKKGEQSNLGLIKGARLKNADLTYARARSAFLAKADLRRANLYGADLREADLRQANLQNANLDYADLSGARLSGAELKGASLKGVKLQGYHFYGSDFQGIDLQNASLQEINFEYANLKGANFEGAELQKVNFRDADLREANFQGATLDAVIYFGMDLQRARLVDVAGLSPASVRKTKNWLLADYGPKMLAVLELPDDLPIRIRGKNLSGMDLQGAVFEDVDLQQFNFSSANLQESVFRQVDLQKADFSRAHLQQAKLQGNLSGVNLAGADLRGAEIRKSNLGQANLQQADCRGARLIELDMSGANLANADMRELTFWNWLIIAGSNLKGADFSGAHIKNARGLTCQQIRQATVDQDTELPDYLGSCGR